MSAVLDPEAEAGEAALEPPTLGLERRARARSRRSTWLDCRGRPSSRRGVQRSGRGDRSCRPASPILGDGPHGPARAARPILRRAQAQRRRDTSVTMTRVRRGLVAVALLAGPRAAPATREPFRPPARLAQALAVPGYAARVGGDRGRPQHGQDGLRAQPRPAARARVEREAAGDVRGAQELGVTYRFRTEVLRQRPPGRHDLARQPRPEGLRRPDADVGRPERLAAQLAGHRDHAHRRARVRRRVVVRRDAAPHPAGSPSFFIFECPPLSALVVDRRVYDSHVALRPRSRRPGSSGGSAGHGHHDRRRPASGRAPAGALRAGAGRVASRSATCSRRWIRTATTSRPSCC